jgi:SagB-type dehydrogenase family enzyme
MKHGVHRLALVLLVVAMAGCALPPSPTPGADASESATPMPTPSRVESPSLAGAEDQKAYEPGAMIALPALSLVGGLSLEEALVQRRSTREFEAAPLTREELGQLLWAAQGITHERGFRTAPSAGALYPLEIYAATEEAVLHYVPHGHIVEVASLGDARTALYEVALRQEAVRHAPAVIIVTAAYKRTAAKYGTARSPRYVQLEAGHAAQNLLLQAVALGLGAVPIGAFDDTGVQRVLGLPSDHEPLYLIPVGNPKGAGG